MQIEDQLLVTIRNLGNCEEGDYDFLYKSCIMSKTEWNNFEMDLQENCSLYYTSDFTGGGHGCVLEIQIQKILDNLYTTPITCSEAKVLHKFNKATYTDKCELVY